MIDIKRAREMLGVPFLHLGRDAKGIDCIGLLAYAYSYPVEQLPPYPRDPVNGELERYLEAVLGSPALAGVVWAADLRPGDIVAMQYAGPLRHVGIVAAHPSLAGQLSLIHTDSTLGEVTEHILDAKWLKRIRKVFR